MFFIMWVLPDASLNDILTNWNNIVLTLKGNYSAPGGEESVFTNCNTCSKYKLNADALQRGDLIPSPSPRRRRE